MTYLFKIIAAFCCVILLLLIAAFVWVQFRKYGNDIKDIPVQEEYGFIKGLYPAAYSIYSFCKNKLHILAGAGKSEDIRKIYTRLDGANAEKFYFCNIFSVIIIAVFCTILFLMVFIITPSKESIIKDGYFIERDIPGGTDKEKEIGVFIGAEEQKLPVNVPARKYSDEEFVVKLKEAMDYVKDNYLGENQSPEKVSKSLNLVSYIPDNAIEISWECDTDNIVSSDGTLERSQVTEPLAVQITAVFSYYGNSKDMPLEFTVLPVNKSKTEILWDKWNEMFMELSDLTATRKFLQLPSETNGQKVLYKVPENNYIMYVLLLGIIIIIFVPIVIDSRINEKLKQREQELRIDYPGFVEKFVLLIGAGLNCKGAWQRMASEYKKKLQDGGRKRYLYEEMLLAERQLENGMNEAGVYELFGKRTGLLKYIKFSTLLVQNLKKGSADLLKVLEYEAADTLKERRENAKILGEQASTKMLMPMIIMMAEVFAIIIYAAFQNM